MGLWDEAFLTDPYAFRTTIDKWNQKATSEKGKNFESSLLAPNFLLDAFFRIIIDWNGGNSSTEN